MGPNLSVLQFKSLHKEYGGHTFLKVDHFFFVLMSTLKQMGLLPFYCEYIHKNPDYQCERMVSVIRQWLTKEPLPTTDVKDAVNMLASTFEKKWSTSAQLYAYLAQNIIDLTDDKDFKITFYVWLLQGSTIDV